MRRTSLAASTIVFLFPLVASAMGIQVIIQGQAVVFADVPQSAWFSSYVHDAAQAGIVNGYKDDQGHFTGTFGPSNNVTVAQALKIAIEGAGYDTASYSSVIDCGCGNHWAGPYVSVAKSEHFAIMQRSTSLDRSATRAEVASIFADSFRVHLDMQPTNNFKDVNTSLSQAPAISGLSRDKVISGDTDSSGTATGFFRPSAFINRAETVKMIMLARVTYGEVGKGRAPQTSSAVTQDQTVVTYSDEGFSPSILHVKAGTAVTFQNESSRPMWVASNPHPSHTGYPGFDAQNAYGQGSIYLFIFNRVGTWGYHNHMNPSDTGTIVVDQ